MLLNFYFIPLKYSLLKTPYNTSIPVPDKDSDTEKLNILCNNK